MTGCCVGIDVSKATLDVAVLPGERTWQVNREEAAIASLVATLRDLSPRLIVLEATGGLEAPVTAALGVAGLPVVVINPRQARDFAKAVRPTAYKLTTYTRASPRLSSAAPRRPVDCAMMPTVPATRNWVALIPSTHLRVRRCAALLGSSWPSSSSAIVVNPLSRVSALGDAIGSR